MKLFGEQLEGFAKVLVILVAILFVSLGLCGISAAVLSGTSGWSYSSGNPLGPIFGTTAVVSGITTLLSFLGIMAVALAWFVSRMFGRSSRHSQEIRPKLFDKDDEPRDK